MNKVINLKSVQMSCTQCSLSQLCLPRGLDKNEFSQLDKIIKHERTLKKGEQLFELGQPFKSLYAVRSGTVKVFLPIKNGDVQVVGFHMPGELLGFDAIGHNEHTCTAVALETCNICELPSAQLHEHALEIPGLYEHLMSLMSDEITEEHEMMLMLGRKSAEERIATFLLNLSARYSKRGFSPHKFNLTMSRNDIANYLGLAVETVSRCITHMQDEKLIEANRKYIHILDMEHLCEFVGTTEHECEMMKEGV